MADIDMQAEGHDAADQAADLSMGKRRKPYLAPELVEGGDVAQITQSTGSGGATDSGYS